MTKEIIEIMNSPNFKKMMQNAEKTRMEIVKKILVDESFNPKTYAIIKNV